MKICSRCKQEKALIDFYADKGHADGLRSECKSCNRERVRKYTRTPKGKISLIEKYKKRTMLYPEKRKAQERIRYEVRAGRIIKPSACERCGRAERIQAHHEDYSKPLDVLWLCEPCHKFHHGFLTDLKLLTKQGGR